MNVQSTKPRLVFVDDDESELRDLEPLLSSDYEYIPLHWPKEQPTRTRVGDPPALFVLDMYLPPRDRPVPEKIDGTELENQRRQADAIAADVKRLYGPVPDDHKALLRKTMASVQDLIGLVTAQWRALGQDPENGLELLASLRREYTGVPIVFYSRKITPEYAVRAMRLGATDVIQKGTVKEIDLLNRLARARAQRAA
jgi:FixJ family two-component response regulator